MNLVKFKEKYYPNTKKKQYDIFFSDPSQRIIGKERKSKLLCHNSELYIMLDTMYVKLAKQFMNKMKPRRMDYHIELIKKEEEWTEDKLNQRCSELHGRCIEISWGVKNDALFIETPSVSGYGKTHITLVKFNGFIPDPVYNYLDLDISDINFIRDTVVKVL